MSAQKQHLLSNEDLDIQKNWYDQYPDEHEIRGEHRACIKRSLNPENHQERDKFNNQFEYLLSVLGFAAGFGSVWRFPYLIYKNGGGVFLIPYFLILFLVGIPSFYFETAIGQMLQRSPPLCFEMSNKKWKGFGVFGILLTLNMSTYYNLILAYSLYYFYESFKFPLPWKIDDIKTSPEPWNTEYFYKDVLHSSSGLESIGGIVWPLFFCYALSQFIVYLCIQKGVTVSGKVSMVTATSPYVLLFILMIRGLFLEGAWTGLHYLFTPDWSKLFQTEVWVDAANQVIFQVSTGCGVLIIFGSYRPISQEIIKSSYYIPIITVLCGLLASVVIFSFMGYMSLITNVSIDDMPLKGPDLAFIVFPAVLTQMPFSNILSMVFFLVMIFLGIDTQFAQIDALAATIEDEFHGADVKYKGMTIPMQYVRAGVCILVSFSAFLFCSQAGFFYLDFVDNYSVSINMFVCLLTESYFYFFVEDWQKIEDKIQLYIGQATPKYMIFLMKYCIPFITSTLSIFAIYLQILDIPNQQWWVSLLGWSLTLYPYYSIYYYFTKYSQTHNETPVSQPTQCTELEIISSITPIQKIQQL